MAGERWPCQKRPHTSPKQARRAQRHAGFRVRTYWCEECRAWHATNSEKRHHAESQDR